MGTDLGPFTLERMIGETNNGAGRMSEPIGLDITVPFRARF